MNQIKKYFMENPKRKIIFGSFIASILIVSCCFALLPQNKETQNETDVYFENITIKEESPLSTYNKQIQIEKSYSTESQNISFQNLNEIDSNYTPTQIQKNEYTKQPVINHEKTTFTKNHDVMNCSCSYTAEQLSSGLLKTIKNYAQYYIDAKEKYGICPLYNAAKDSYESGWGEFAPGNNLGGVKTEKKFSSPEEFIDWWSKYQLEHYLTPQGKYYHGTTIAGINKCYNGRESWENTVPIIMTQIHNRIVENQNN